MRAVKTILSICFLFLAAIAVADEAEVSNELPDEIKNLDSNLVLEPSFFLIPNFPKNALENNMEVEVWVKFYLDKEGSVRSASIAYCSFKDSIFENQALRSVLNSEFATEKLLGWNEHKAYFFLIGFKFNKVSWYGKDSLKTYNDYIDSDYINGSEILPELVKRGRTDYPRKARQKGITGKVFVKALVSSSGKVTAVKIQKTCDPKWEWGINEAVIQSVKNSQFEPAKID